MSLADALKSIIDILATSSQSPAFGTGPGEDGWVNALSSVLSSVVG